MQMNAAVFKLCIFGDGGVGKTTLVQKFLTGLFTPDTRLTVGVDFHIKKLVLDDVSITLQIWDFAGEERFRFLLPSYLRGANGGIFMFDVTRFTSLRNIDKWIEALQQDSTGTLSRIPIFLVGGKIDLVERRSIEYDYAFEMAKEKNLYGYGECSAKSGENVEEIFEAITRIMLQNSGILED